MSRKYFVYVHVSPSNKRYVGITSQTKPEWRWSYEGRGYESNEHFWRSINKYGWDNFEHLVVASNLTKEEACALEQKLIAEYNTTDSRFGYNHTSGGEHGIPSSETLNKLSKIRKGKSFSEEHKRHLSESMKGKKHGKWVTNGSIEKMIPPNTEPEEGWAYGRLKVSEESKSKISKALKGRPGHPCKWKGQKREDDPAKRPEVRLKISKALKGKPKSPEHIAKLRALASARTGYVWIHKEEKQTKIKIEKLQTFLESGWQKGRK